MRFQFGASRHCACRKTAFPNCVFQPCPGCIRTGHRHIPGHRFSTSTFALWPHNPCTSALLHKRSLLVKQHPSVSHPPDPRQFYCTHHCLVGGVCKHQNYLYSSPKPKQTSRRAHRPQRAKQRDGHCLHPKPMGQPKGSWLVPVLCWAPRVPVGEQGGRWVGAGRAESRAECSPSTQTARRPSVRRVNCCFSAALQRVFLTAVCGTYY